MVLLFHKASKKFDKNSQAFAEEIRKKNNKNFWISEKNMPRLSAEEAERIDRKTRERLEKQVAEQIRKRRQKERQWAKARKANSSAKPPPAQHDAQREKSCAAWE